MLAVRVEVTPMTATPTATRAAAELELRRRNRERWRDDPAAFARERLGVELTPDQEAIMLSVRDNPSTAVKAGNAVGKTHVSGTIVAWWMEVWDDAIVITTAPTDKQVKDLLWKEIRARAHTARPPLSGEILPRGSRWWITHDRFAVGKTAKDEEGIKGQHSPHLLIVVDEAAGVPEFVYDGIESMLDGATNRLLLIGNPTTTSGSFYDAFHSQAGIWNTLTVAVPAHPNIVAGLETLGLTWEEYKRAPFGEHPLPAGWEAPIPGAVTLAVVDRRKVRFGVDTPAWDATIEGRFPSGTDRNLVALAWVEAARTYDPTAPVGLLPHRLAPPAGRWAGLDVARYGSDRSCLVLMDGSVVESIETWQGHELSHTAGRAYRAIRDGYTLSYDEGGLGAAITSHLKEHGVKVGEQAHPVNAGAAPQPAAAADYPKRRDQLWGDAADLLRAGAVDLSRLPRAVYQELLGEWTAVEYQIDSASRRRVEPKDALKKRIGRSPDIADAVNLALHRPSRTVRVEPHTHAGQTITAGIMEELW